MSTAEKLHPAVQIKLKVLKGPHEGQSFHLAKSSFTVGRGPENEVVLINDPQISRQHARLTVVGQDIEIINLSKKNKVMVGSEEIQKWKLVNDSTFVLGDTELQIAFEIEKITPIAPLPQLVRIDAPPSPPTPGSPAPAAVPQAKKSPLKRPMPPANRQQVPAQRQGQVQARGPMQPGRPGPQGQMMPRPNQQMGPQFIPEMQMGAPRGAPAKTSASGGGLLSNPKARFYLIVGAAVLGLVYWLKMEEPKKAQPTEIKSTLKYEDEYLVKLNSVTEKELDQKRQVKLEQKLSPTNLRVEENFQKGMRDFQLGNYKRALDFFQVVLNLDSTHVMARRHLYLSKIRFDEIIKTKLALGESYYQKHNFKMCGAMYDQICIMLDGQICKEAGLTSPDLQTAKSMSKKCLDAVNYGIR